MKQGKKLQRWMKELLTKKRLDPYNYLYVKNEPGKLTVLHIYSMKIKEIHY